MPGPFPLIGSRSATAARRGVGRRSSASGTANALALQKSSPNRVARAAMDGNTVALSGSDGAGENLLDGVSCSRCRRSSLRASNRAKCASTSTPHSSISRRNSSNLESGHLAFASAATSAKVRLPSHQSNSARKNLAGARTESSRSSRRTTNVPPLMRQALASVGRISATAGVAVTGTSAWFTHTLY